MCQSIGWIWNLNDMIIKKISIPRTITLQRTHMFEILIYAKVSECDFLDIVDDEIYNFVIYK